MPQTAFGEVLRYLRQICSAEELRKLSDAELLERFLRHREEGAFAVLVRRHGAMVQGVCRRVLGDFHSAEDAFQATFLVLARRAGSIRNKESVAGWLYGVALRIASKAKSREACRHHGRRRLTDMPGAEPIDELTWQELKAVLDEEVGRLPEKNRLPIVLCYFEGKSHEQAAKELGWARRSLTDRLARGRDLLRRHLVRRGMTLSAGILATALTEKTLGAPVGATVVMNTMRAIAHAAFGRTAFGRSASTRALAMAEEALRGMTWVKAKAVLLVLTIGLAASGAGMAAVGRVIDESVAESALAAAPREAMAVPQKKEPAAATDFYGDPLPAGAVARLGTIRLNHGSNLNSLHFLPDGKTIVSEGGGFVRLFDAVTGAPIQHFAQAQSTGDRQTLLSKDGKVLTVLNQRPDGDTLETFDLVQGKEVGSVLLPIKRSYLSAYEHNAISPDGKLFALHSGKQIDVYDLATAKPLYAIPNGDGDAWAVLFNDRGELVIADKKQSIQLLDALTGKLLRQFQLDFPFENANPHFLAKVQGSRLAILEHPSRTSKAPNGEAAPVSEHDVIHVFDLTTGTRTQSLVGPDKAWHTNLQFSEDGKFLFAANVSHDNRQYEVTVWNVESGTNFRRLRGANAGKAIKASPDGNHLAVADYSGKIDVWDLKTGKRVDFEDTSHALTETVLLPPTGDRILTFGTSSVSTWDKATGRLLRTFDLPAYTRRDPGRLHAFSPDGRYALSQVDDKGRVAMQIFDVASGQRLHTLAPPNSPQAAGEPAKEPNVMVAIEPMFAFAADSSVLAACYPGPEVLIRLWDVRAGKEIRSLKVDKGHVAKDIWAEKNSEVYNAGSLFFTADGKSLILNAKEVVGYEVASGREVFSWEAKPLQDMTTGGIAVIKKKDGEMVRITPAIWRAFAFSPDGTVAAGILNGGSGNIQAQNRLVLCDARTGKAVYRWSDSGKPARTGDHLIFSPDGRLLATSDNETVHLWELATGKEIRSLHGHLDDVRALSFSADSRYLISASYDTTCLIWDVALAVGTAKPLANAPGEKEIADWWADLAGADPGRGYAAVYRLAASPKTAVPFLARQLRPVPKVVEKEIQQYIADLQSEKFAVRDKASLQLKALAADAETALRLALKENVSLEMRLRLEQLLDNLRARIHSGDRLRTLRALTVLELAGTPEARQLLDALADGAPGAWLTREAVAIRERIALRNQ
jgi:RNA polymerase sigma factor (sigma-70 family)